MLLKLQWLTDIFDWLHHNWERAHVQRKVALVIFWVYVAALCCVELKRQGMLPPALAQLTPHSHFSAIQLAFTLILGLEVMSLIFIISTSFSRSVGKQFEILALILLRNAFKELAHLPEPVSIAGNLDPVIHIAVTALGALGIFVALGIYGKLASSYAYIQSPEMRMRFVISKKLLSLTLFVIFLGIGIRDAWIHIHTGEDMRFFETIYTVLIFADIALVLISQRYMPSFHAVFRNSGFVIGTLMMRLALSATPPWDTAASLFAAAYVLALTWATRYFRPAALRGPQLPASSRETEHLPPSYGKVPSPGRACFTASRIWMPGGSAARSARPPCPWRGKPVCSVPRKAGPGARCPVLRPGRKRPSVDLRPGCDRPSGRLSRLPGPLRSRYGTRPPLGVALFRARPAAGDDVSITRPGKGTGAGIPRVARRRGLFPFPARYAAPSRRPP